MCGLLYLKQYIKNGTTAKCIKIQSTHWAYENSTAGLLLMYLYRLNHSWAWQGSLDLLMLNQREVCWRIKTFRNSNILQFTSSAWLLNCKQDILPTSLDFVLCLLPPIKSNSPLLLLYSLVLPWIQIFHVFAERIQLLTWRLHCSWKGELQCIRY